MIYLNDANPTREEALEVIFTPGHTSDSIALYYPAEKKIFVGDTLCMCERGFSNAEKPFTYLDPFTAIHLDCIGSNVIQCMNRRVVLL